MRISTTLAGCPLIASLYPHIPIYATESTRVLTEILLRDSVRIMEQEGLTPDGETPLYTAEQVDALLGRIQSVALAHPFAPISSAPGITVRFLRAGHILGAAILFFQTTEGTLLLTGDLLVTDQRSIKGLDLAALLHADIMLCEGTYDNRSHGSRREEERRLAQTVQSVQARGGRVLLPAFAVGRTQEVALILKAFRASGQLSPVPVYLEDRMHAVCAAYNACANSPVTGNPARPHSPSWPMPNPAPMHFVCQLKKCCRMNHCCRIQMGKGHSKSV